MTPEGQSRSNPRVLTSICASISEQLGISGRAFVTFPEYELATGWRFQTIFDTYQESNMAAGNRKCFEISFNTRYLCLYYAATH